MAITICTIYQFIAILIAFNAYRGAKRTKARLTYITWLGAPRLTLRDSRGRFILITPAFGNWQNMEYKPMNASKPIDNNYQLTLRGFFFACKYLKDNNAMTKEECKAFERFPYGRREDYIAIVQRANKLRNDAHRKALVINGI